MANQNPDQDRMRDTAGGSSMGSDADETEEREDARGTRGAGSSQWQGGSSTQGSTGGGSMGGEGWQSGDTDDESGTRRSSDEQMNRS